jgi:hypothetical protein
VIGTDKAAWATSLLADLSGGAIILRFDLAHEFDIIGPRLDHADESAESHFLQQLAAVRLEHIARIGLRRGTELFPLSWIALRPTKHCPNWSPSTDGAAGVATPWPFPDRNRKTRAPAQASNQFFITAPSSLSSEASLHR